MNIQNLKGSKSPGSCFQCPLSGNSDEDLGPFQIASTFPENVTVWPVFFADLCNTSKNRDGVLLFSL